MTMPNGMREATPPPLGVNRTGRKPKLLTDEKVKILLSSPNVWYIISTTDKHCVYDTKEYLAFS